MASNRKKQGDSARDQAYFRERYALVGSMPMSWEEVLTDIDEYEQEVLERRPDIFTDRLILGDACLTLLMAADGMNIPTRRKFVEHILGPTKGIDLMRVLPQVMEFREWAVQRITEKEERAAAAAARRAAPPPDDEPPF